MKNNKTIDELKIEVESCSRCKLSTTRKKIVFGEGSSTPSIMFIGEGPGKNEDLQGRPFIGRSGELLTRIIVNGMGISRDEVFITNIVKCRPTVDMKMIKDRAPDPSELKACTPFLLEQLEILKPKVIVTLGSPATKFILKTTIGITKMRGIWGEYMGIPVMPTFHPSYVLRNGGDKSPLKKNVWEDIKKVMILLNMEIPE